MNPSLEVSISDLKGGEKHPAHLKWQQLLWWENKRKANTPQVGQNLPLGKGLKGQMYRRTCSA